MTLIDWCLLFTNSWSGDKSGWNRIIEVSVVVIKKQLSAVSMKLLLVMAVSQPEHNFKHVFKLNCFSELHNWKFSFHQGSTENKNFSQCFSYENIAHFLVDTATRAFLLIRWMACNAMSPSWSLVHTHLFSSHVIAPTKSERSRCQSYNLLKEFGPFTKFSCFTCPTTRQHSFLLAPFFSLLMYTKSHNN